MLLVGDPQLRHYVLLQLLDYQITVTVIIIRKKRRRNISNLAIPHIGEYKDIWTPTHSGINGSNYLEEQRDKTTYIDT